MDGKIFVIALLGAIALSGCSDKVKTAETATAIPATTDTQPTTQPKEEKEAMSAEHFYSMKDGMEYGYEHALSEDDQQKGQAAAQLTMFKYAGEKDGKYQAYVKANGATQVIECDKECKYIKIMIFIGNEHAKTERIAGGNGSIASSVMADAIGGQLEQAVLTSKADKSKKSHVWFSEQEGAVLTPIAN